jgi:hypothetical protein
MNPNVSAPPSVKTKSDTGAPGKPIQPPTVGDKPEKAPKVAKEKAPVDPNAPKKERAAKKDYGYSKASIIKVLKPDASFKGQRGEWFQRIKDYDGKTCGEFCAAFDKVPNNKGKFYAPSGNLRGAARRGTIEMIRPATPAVEPTK